MLITALLHKQFHWQFLINYSGFWLVNILLKNFNIHHKKEMKMTETDFFDYKQQQKMSLQVQSIILYCEINPTEP